MTDFSKWLISSMCLLSSAAFAAQISPFNQPKAEPPKPASESEQWGGQAPYRINQSNGLALSLQALVWQPHLNIGYSTARKTILDDGVPTNKYRVISPKAHWDWGFRLGAAYLTPRDDWEFGLEWTHIHLKMSDKTSGARRELFVPNPLTPDTFATSARAKVPIRLNYWDLMLRRDFLVTRRLSVKPAIGLKYLRLHGKLNTSFSGGTLFSPFNSSFKNNFWGIGPKAELNTRWRFANNFSLYGDFGFAFLYGLFNLGVKSNILQQGSVTVQAPYRATNRVRQTVPTLDYTLGLRWDTMFSDGRYHLSLNAGWEHHVFFQILQADILMNYDVNNGNLTTQGITFGARFDF